MVRANKKVILKEVMECGMSSGRNTDKVAKTGLEMQSMPGCDI
jgi:hypothetical protein